MHTLSRATRDRKIVAGTQHQLQQPTYLQRMLAVMHAEDATQTQCRVPAQEAGPGRSQVTPQVHERSAAAGAQTPPGKPFELS